MFIRNIRASNFKSYEEVNVDIGSFNTLVGINGSGKSNFIDILRFIKDMVEDGLESAILMHGGAEYVRNININASKNLSIELLIDSKDQPNRFGFAIDEKRIETEIYEYLYRLDIEFYKRGKDYKVAEERLEAICDFAEEEETEEKKTVKKEVKEKKKAKRQISFTITDFDESKDIQKDRKGKFIMFREKNKLKYKFIPIDTQEETEYTLSPFFHKTLGRRLSSKESFIEKPIFFPILYRLVDFVSQIPIYDIDPKLSKKTISITGKTELEADGGNLAVVLKHILDDKEDRERFSSLIRDLLPFIEKFQVQKRWAQKFLLTTLSEVGSEEKFLPAFLISDGTINITALIVILYFEMKSLVIIEEPERNIHPYLISRIVDMMRDVSERLEKQIIVTTHNPEVVRYAGIENILLVYRDEKMFSKISRPYEKDEVKTFLENEMGIEELYVQNLLEW